CHYRAEHRRRMAAGLQEQRIDEDGADRGSGEQACKHVFRAVQENTHHEAALFFRFDRSRLRTTTAAARHFLIVVNTPRHASSPDELDPLTRAAARVSASRRWLKAPAAAQSQAAR